MEKEDLTAGANECSEDNPRLLAALDQASAKANSTLGQGHLASVVRARLASFNREQEEAARDLGASEWATLWDVIVPHMKPGLFAGATLVFLRWRRE